jgi:hypothetical protein
MSVSSNVPELAVPHADIVDAAEISRCLETAAVLVQSFAERCTVGALDALLAAAGDGPAIGLDRAHQIADGVLQQTVTLHEEVGRFLSLTKN